MATQPNKLRRAFDGPLQGMALGVYVVLLPYVVATRWNLAQSQSDATFIRALLVVLASLWLVILVRVGRDVWHLHEGGAAGTGASAWLAGLLVAVMPFLASSTFPLHHGASTSRALASLSVQRDDHRSSGPSAPSGLSLGGLPLALIAKRRSDLLRQQQYVNIDDDVDETVSLLRSLNPDLIARLRRQIGACRDGVIDINSSDASSTLLNTDAVVALALPGSSSLVSFAKEGGVLSVPATWSSDDIREAVVALHEGKVVFADSEMDLLRALATRTVRHCLVIYLGRASELDEELRDCSVTLRALAVAPRALATTWQEAPDGRDVSSPQSVRVDLLRADPSVVGLVEPFAPTLRRRCVEMLAYLALHRHEPVTGDRLRTRVLTHADVDASLRTLANTATAVRRSLGSDVKGPRLHAVSSSGLYETHGVSSDVEIFTTLIGRARELFVVEAAPLAHQALAMIKGEPLASALRGFEWFLAEGFAARLSRDGEWAALVVHHDALEHDNYELAFWALRQGLLIDPFSDVLLDAVAKVPRLREFGGDRSGLSKDLAVGARRGESMSWSFTGFTNQVTE